MKKFIVLIVLILLITQSNGKAQNVSGTIYFYDGTEQAFTNFILFLGANEKGANINIGKSKSSFYHHNSLRTVQHSKLHYFEIKDVGKVWSKTCYQSTEVEIGYVTGKKAKVYCNLLQYVYVVLFDEYSGELQEVKVDFAKKGKPHVKKIIFDNSLEK